MTTEQLDELKAIQDAYLEMASKRQEAVKEPLEEAVGGFGSHYSKSEKEKEMADDHKGEKETSYRSKSPKRSGFSALDRWRAKQGIKEEELDESGWPSKGESMKTTATITKNKDGSTTTAFSDGTWKIESKGYKAEKKPTNLVYTHAKSDVAYRNLVYKKSGPDIYQLNKEEVEELDELSKATLGSYVKKASNDKADYAFQQGRLAGHQTKNKDAIQTSIDKEKKRRAGISKAVGKLTKEEVESLEEEKIPVNHAHDAVGSVLGQSAAVKFATNLKAGTNKHTTWKDINKTLVKQGEQTHHIAKIAAKLKPAQYNEEVEELDEAKKEPMEVYHTGYSAALQHAEKHLNKQGYEIHPDDWQHHISHGPSRPSEGKTVELHVPLHKDGVKSKKVAHIQVYNRGNTIPKNNELNMYVN